MDACDRSVMGRDVVAFVRALTPDALIEQPVREHPTYLQTLYSPWCIAINEGVPP
jgi:hypothetical protein